MVRFLQQNEEAIISLFGGQTPAAIGEWAAREALAHILWDLPHDAVGRIGNRVWEAAMAAALEEWKRHSSRIEAEAARLRDVRLRAQREAQTASEVVRDLLQSGLITIDDAVRPAWGEDGTCVGVEVRDHMGRTRWVWAPRP